MTIRLEIGVLAVSACLSAVVRRFSSTMMNCSGRPPFEEGSTYIAALVNSAGTPGAYELAQTAGALVPQVSPGVFAMQGRNETTWREVRRAAGGMP